MRISAIVLVVAAAGSAAAQPFEFVVSEYTLAGVQVRTYGGAGVDTGIDNRAIAMSPSGDVYVTRSTLSSPAAFKGSVEGFTRTGSPIESFALDGVNQSNRGLEDLAFDAAGNIYTATRNGIGPIGHPDSTGSIFRIDANTDAISVLQPFGNAPDYTGITVTGTDRIYASSWRGSFTGDDQVIETNAAGASLNEFSPTGNGIRHLEIAHSNSATLIALTRDATGGGAPIYGWRRFDLAGNLLGTVSIGDSSVFNPIGLDMDAVGTLWTYNLETQSAERYRIDGTLLESHPITVNGDFIRDFMYTPDGAALFAYRIEVPTPGTAGVLGLAGIVAGRRRR